MAESLLMVRWVIRSILHGGPIALLFQPVLHYWYNKGHGVYYPVWDGVKRSLAANQKE